jgi:hypothetical protein
VLTDPLDRWFKRLIREAEDAHSMKVRSPGVMPGHVRVFVGAGHTLAVTEIFNRLKGAVAPHSAGRVSIAAHSQPATAPAPLLLHGCDER